ncbi:hypothetical protein B0J12DRAFT_679287 [Macrophomina phaseolina]|uniref:Uncharacterized protein n=1 Tax=Macrophomina phaseolina TaxID=35725 RepID=A0ABQ8G0Q3_9PEZI|nr:hypothetical protein B0J12DRAFT_679287 [Macrophomina phaseolina]
MASLGIFSLDVFLEWLADHATAWQHDSHSSARPKELSPPRPFPFFPTRPASHKASSLSLGPRRSPYGAAPTDKRSPWRHARGGGQEDFFRITQPLRSVPPSRPLDLLLCPH